MEELHNLRKIVDDLALGSESKLQHVSDRLVPLECALLRSQASSDDNVLRHVNEKLDVHCKLLLQRCEEVAAGDKAVLRAELAAMDIDCLRQSIQHLMHDLEVSKADMKEQIQRIAVEMKQTSEVTMQVQASMAQTEHYMTESLAETYQCFESRLTNLKTSQLAEKDNGNSHIKAPSQSLETIQMQLVNLSDKVGKLDETRTLSTAGLSENIEKLIEDRLVEHRAREALQQTPACPDQMDQQIQNQHGVGVPDAAAVQATMEAHKRAIDTIALDVQAVQDAHSSEYLDMRTSIQRLTSKIAQVEALEAHCPNELVQKVEQTLGDFRTEMDLKLGTVSSRTGIVPNEFLKLRADMEQVRQHVDSLLVADLSPSTNEEARPFEQSSSAPYVLSVQKVQRQMEDLNAKLERLEQDLSVGSKIFKNQPNASGEFALQASFNAQTEALEAEVTKQHTLISELHMRLAKEIADVSHRIEAQREEISRVIEVKLEEMRSGISSASSRRDTEKGERSAPVTMLYDEKEQSHSDESLHGPGSTGWSSLFGYT